MVTYEAHHKCPQGCEHLVALGNFNSFEEAEQNFKVYQERLMRGHHTHKANFEIRPILDEQ